MSATNKVLSLIIPTYNMERLLRHTLDSLIISEKNLAMLEVLVINDGSKDGSLAIAQEYASRYPGVIIAVDKPNGNYGSCINRGLLEATGKYVKVLDADDSFDTENLDKYIEFLQNQNSDLVLTDFSVVNERGEQTDLLTYSLPQEKQFSLKDISPKMSNWLFHQVITYKTEIFRKFDYHQTEGVSYTDDEWALEPMMMVETVVYYPCVIYKYLRGREGQTTDEAVIKKTLTQRIVVAKSLLSFYNKYSSSFKEQAKAYITNKLVIRVAMIYNHFLTRSYSKSGMPGIIEFDTFLKNSNSDIYERLNTFTNSYGMKYIYQWRHWNYSAYCPALVIMRMKRLVFKLTKKDINALNMPNDLRRIK